MYVMLTCCIFFTSSTKAEREISHKVIFFLSTVLFCFLFFPPALWLQNSKCQFSLSCVFFQFLTLPKQQKQLWEKVTLVGMLFFCVSVCVDYFKEFPRFKKLFCLFSSSFLFLKFRNETNPPPPPSVWFSSLQIWQKCRVMVQWHWCLLSA